MKETPETHSAVAASADGVAGGGQGEDVSLNRSHCADFLALKKQEEAPLSSNHQLQHWPLEMRINYAHQRKPTLDWRPMSCGWSVDDDRGPLFDFHPEGSEGAGSLELQIVMQS